MAMIILITAVIVEIAFATFCITTKSNHAKERSMIRIASFMGFVLLAVLSVIDWSFRYYALAAMLLLLSIIGAVNLIQKKEETRDYRAVPVVLRAIGMTVLIFALILPAILFPQNKAVVETTGDYQVLIETYTYIDTGRSESYANTGKNRKLNVQMWYPDDLEGTYPLVVFSHGGLGIKTSNESLFNELASHGYIVCSIDHTYQCLYTTDEGGNTTLVDFGYLKELFAEDAQSDIEQSFDYYQKWMKIRTDDLNFVIDYIITEAENSNADTVYKLVDTAKIGLMGHSLGGSAALGSGRKRADISAVIALESPFMCDIEGIEGDQFVFTDKIYPIPVLNVYSDNSWSILAERPQYALNYAMLSQTDSAAFNVYLSGIGHLALTDFALTSPLLTRILDRQNPTAEAVYTLERINKICLKFFNSYLKGT